MRAESSSRRVQLTPPLPPRRRRSFIESAVHEQKVAVYSSCHEAAKEMGGFLQPGQGGGLLDSLKKLIPLPFFK
jgi:hypothetical protein